MRRQIWAKRNVNSPVSAKFRKPVKDCFGRKPAKTEKILICRLALLLFVLAV